MTAIRTEGVGSLLRPAELLEARQQFEEGRLTAPEFKSVEDRAVDLVIARQEEAGLGVVTDGEMRRLSFQSQMTEAVDGFGDCPIDAFLWGDWHGDEVVGDHRVERPDGLGVIGRLTRRRHLCAEEFTYLRSRTICQTKVTLPSPSLWANLWSPQVASDVYPTLDSFLEDILAITRGEVEELVRLGADYIQIDAPHYMLLVDERTRAFYEERGWDLSEWLSRGIDLDNAVMDGFPGVTFGFHL